MKLPVALLKSFIELPSDSLEELRALLDESGLEVKNVEITNEKAIFTIETLANRADHASVLGVARELASRLALSLKSPQLGIALTEAKVSLPVRRNTPLCPRYALLELLLPDILPAHPDVEAILGASERHSLVDIANYVQLELGQPMHVFDRDKIDGEISVAGIEQDQEIIALDGKSYTVPSGALVIRDRVKVVAVAGVIGCANSMADTSTRRVLVESATFDPIKVRLTARAMGLATDASFIFERGSDREMIVPALRRLFFLAKQVSGGNVKDVGFINLEAAPTERRLITVDPRNIRKHTNLPRLADAEITTRLKHLGFGLEKASPTELLVSVPSWRLWDITREEDMVEEVVRTLGLNRVKALLPSMEPSIPELSPIDAVKVGIEPYVLGAGFVEVITSGFYAERDIQLLDSLQPGLGGKHIRIKNAIEQDHSGIRITPILHMGDAINWNVARGLSDIKIFEYPVLFTNFGEFGENPKNGGGGDRPNNDGEPAERAVIAMMMAGAWERGCLGITDDSAATTLKLKGLVESICEALGVEITVVTSKIPVLHPGIQGRILHKRKHIGFIGQLHPRIADRRKWKRTPIYAELDLHSLAAARSKRGAVTVSQYPEVRRDITLGIGATYSAARVLKTIRDLELAALRDCEIVSHFVKEGEPLRRVTYRLTFQDSHRTLAKEEVDATIEVLLANLSDKHQIAMVG